MTRRFCGEDYYTRDYIAIQDSFLKELRNAVDNKVNSLWFTARDHSTGALLDFVKWLEDNGYQIKGDIEKKTYEELDIMAGVDVIHHSSVWTMKVWWPAIYDSLGVQMNINATAASRIVWIMDNNEAE